MSYHFDGVDDQVVFAKGAVDSYSFGPGTIAILVKRNALGAAQMFGGVQHVFGAERFLLEVESGNALRFGIEGFGHQPTTPIVLGSTSTWYLIVGTNAGSGAKPRFHMYDGASWVHFDSFGGQADAGTNSGDKLIVGGQISGGSYMSADVVCIGIKKADQTDAQVMTLSATSFPAWQAFGFDWLVGFDAAGTRSDIGSDGTGDETSRVGTTLAADPPGWAWIPAPTLPDPATTDWVPLWDLSRPLGP